jgi:Putative GTPase activating protein for Arf
MRCATLHRKIGTHISKVKSLSMDSWTSDQVEVSQSIGQEQPKEECMANGQQDHEKERQCRRQ